MPTKDEIDKLRNSSYCTKTWKRVNNVNGWEFKGLADGPYADNSVFLPAAGYYNRKTLITNSPERSAIYWSSTTRSTDEESAYCMHYDSSTCPGIYGKRFFAGSVRAVLAED